MRWTSLGHAGWLVEAGGLRILCDPLLGDSLHGGLHLVHPPRVVDTGALRPDLVVVSHVHPDHFDVPSLAALARTEPDVPVLTADPFVAETCRALGFRTASVLDPWRALRLGELVLLTTPSLGPVTEWGIGVSDPTGTAWNQVDSVLDAAAVAAVREGLRAEVGRGEIDLALVHWCPLREIEAVTAGSLAFPTAGWVAKLEALAALAAPAIVPAASGFRHDPRFAWRDHHVFPATERMLARDLRVLAPATRVLPSGPGLVYVVEGGETTVERSPWITPTPSAALPPWAPLEVPAMVDPALGGETADTIRAEVHPWLDAVLAPAIANARPVGLGRPLQLWLEIVLPNGDREHHTFAADDRGVVHRLGADPDHDAVVTIAGSMFADVIAGRRHWGEPLLAGLLRGARRLPVLPAFFPYWALSYRASVERWVAGQVACERH